MLLKKRIFRPYQYLRNYASESDTPFHRPMEVIRSDLAAIRDMFKGKKSFESERQPLIFPPHADVVIIGGGLVGSSIAYWLKERARHTLEVVVIDINTEHIKSSILKSARGIRQQYSLPENIQMSLFGADFFRNSVDNLGADIDLKYTPQGNLTLADKMLADTIESNMKIQKEQGLNNIKLSPSQINEKYPWINTDDVAFGCLGSECEGWFDSAALLWGLRRRAVHRGARYFKGELVSFKFKLVKEILKEGVMPGTFQNIDAIVVEIDGKLKEIEFAKLVIAAGSTVSNIAELANIGRGDSILSFELPIEARKRNVYLVEYQNSLPLTINTPMVSDVSGLWLRKDGFENTFLVGRPPNTECDLKATDCNVDYDFFHNEVLPALNHRVPSCKDNIKVIDGRAYHCEYNKFDENGIIGYHPYYENMIFASGFTSQGVQQVPAIGKAISELILEGDYVTIDLTRLNFDRIITDTKFYETFMV